jgi:hypothetical protein
MPRLSEDQIKAGILHDDIDVRTTAVRYFAESFSANAAVMPVVIEALARFGRNKTFRYDNPMSRLAQTEETIRWAVDELRTHAADIDYREHVARLLRGADPRLLTPFEKDIASSGRLDRDAQKQLTHRLRLLSWDEDALWREMEAICEEGKAKNYMGEVRWDDANDIVEELGRRSVRHIDRMMELLKQNAEELDNNPQKWMAPLVIRLAGEWKHEPAIPLIVAKTHLEGEVDAEECVDALVRIGGDDVVRAVRHDFPSANWHFRLFATGVFERVHAEASIEAIIDLLPGEKDGDLVMFLGNALVRHFSTEGNDAARTLVIDQPDLTEVRDGLLVSCALTGQDFPELAGWKKEREEERRQGRERQHALTQSMRLPPLARNPRPNKLPALPQPAPIANPPTGPKVGRNDPCPCRSGKKYKHCCLNKARSPI